MQTEQTTATENVNVENSNAPEIKKEKKVRTPKEKKETIEKVSKLNLSSFAKQLANVEITEKKNREHLYIYPEHIKTDGERNGKPGKTFRRKLRDLLDKHCFNIRIAVKQKNEKDVLLAIKNFDSFYKENYRVNNYELNSLTNKQDEKTGDLKLMLDIIKHVKNSKK